MNRPLQSGDPEYTWAGRHTWQSWRERYKKNATRLDALITSIVEQKKPLPGEKGQIGYVRQAEQKPKRSRKKRVKHEEPLDALEELVPSVSLGHSQAPGIEGEDLHSFNQIQQGGASYSQPPADNLLDHSTMGRTINEEEMDEEGTEWMVRIGNAEPPAWAKRKAPDTELDIPNAKRMRTGYVPVLHILLPGCDKASEFFGDREPGIQETTALNPQALVTIPSIHVIDQSIRDIAQEFRFTDGEVQEYYDKCGEMARTRDRFQRMRQELTLKFSDD